MEIDFGSVNWLAVLVSAVATFMVGGIWYGAVFAKKWVAVHGFSEEEQASMAKKTGRNFGIFFVADLVMGCVLSILIANLGIASFGQGACLGLLLWLGIKATQTAGKNAAYDKSMAAYLIDTGHELATLLVMCSILGGWR